MTSRAWFMAGLLALHVPLAWSQSDLAQLDTMTIFGEAEDLPRTVGSAHLVDEAQLRSFAYDDLNRVLNTVPGLYIREEDGFGLRPNIGLRGANSDRSQKITLMEDGVLFGPAPYAAPAAYYFPLTVRMTGVEVYKGPAAIPYGPQTIGGAINLLSAPLDPDAPGLLSLAGGSFAYRRAQYRQALSLGQTDVQAEVVHVASDGFKELPSGADTGFDKTEAMLRLGRNLGPGRLELRFGYATEVSDETYLGLTEDDFRRDADQRYAASALDRMDWDWQGLRADYVLPVWGGRLHATAYDHRFTRAWLKFNNLRGADIRDVLANPDTPGNRLFYQSLTGAVDTDPNLADDDILIGTNDRDFRSSGLQARWDKGFAAGGWQQQLSLGMRLHSDRITRLHDEDAFEMRDGRLVLAQGTTAITADNTGRAEATALWARHELQRGRLTVVPGLRVESIRNEFADRRDGLRESAERYTVALPGVGLNWALSDDLNWLFGIHRGFSPAGAGLEIPEPEIAWNLEAGARWRHPALGYWEIIGFASRYSNLSAQCTFSAGCSDDQIGQQTNAGRVLVYGLEMVGSRRWSLGQSLSLPVQLSYTYTQGEFRDSFTSPNPQFGDVEEGFELPYVPEHRASLLVGLNGSQWETNATLSYVSAMRDQAGVGPINAANGSDSFAVLDLAARYELSEAWVLTGRVDNVLDRDYVVARRPFGARPGLPRYLQIGVDWRF